MTEQKEKRERGVKVYLKNSIWVEDENTKTPKKLMKGTVTVLSSEQVKHYGKAVTKDIPEDQEGE